MPFGQVDDMHIIAHAGAVGGIVIVAEHRQFGQPARGDATDEGHQIIGDAVRILADQRAVVRTDRVEISQHADAPAGIGGGDVAQHLLDHQLGPAVRVGCRCRMGLVERQILRLAVHGRAR